ncbi:MAG: dienelactone hydrolase family protein [Natronomonas sp.]
MATQRILVGGDRDVRASLDDSGDADSCVVACPPHPQMGGRRGDPRLRAISGELDGACLRFDYGPWDDGAGEITDARMALEEARQRYEKTALFGYSFGGAVATVAAARESDAGAPPAALAVLAPAATVDEVDVAEALRRVDCPIAVVYGSRDETVETEAVVEAAREVGATVEEIVADHGFGGRTQQEAADILCGFLNDHLG